MKPRVLDNRRAGTARAFLTLALLVPALAGGAVSVRDIRTHVHTHEGFTRCVVELSSEAKFNDQDFLAAKEYFIVDVYGVRPGVAERFITPATGPVRQIFVLNRRADDGTPVLTLVVYLTETRRYRVFSVTDPFRVVVDVFHGASAAVPAPVASGPTGTVPAVAAANIDRSATEGRIRFPGKRIVILDPGHGGSDPGALSAIRINKRAVREKDINLQVAKRLQRLINRSPNMVAVLTRDTDKYMSLSDRVRFCENYFGDLFVSIHCNAAGSRRARGARGIEFYYLNPHGATSKYLRLLERIENRNGPGDTDESPKWELPILRALARESLLKWLNEGKVVCEYLKAACYRMPYYERYNNRENVIQSARFRVLFQAEMPAVLVELGFLTNSSECTRLVNSAFQEQVATALYNGTAAYFHARDDRFQPQYLRIPPGP